MSSGLAEPHTHDVKIGPSLAGLKAPVGQYLLVEDVLLHAVAMHNCSDASPERSANISAGIFWLLMWLGVSAAQTWRLRA